MVSEGGFVISSEAILAAFKEAPEAEAKYNAIELELLTKMTFLPSLRDDARKSVNKPLKFTEAELDYIVEVMKKVLSNENVVETVTATMANTQRTYASDMKHYLAYVERIGMGVYPVPVTGASIRNTSRTLSALETEETFLGLTLTK